MPNRLKSAFSGSAWTFDEASGQYYLHLFSKTTRFKLGKPTNASVGLRDDEFWIDKGIGGFRLDVIDLVGKIPGEEITANGPHLHRYLQEMNAATFGGKELLTVGETWGHT